MELYFDLIKNIPEFLAFDTMGEEIYIESEVSPLGALGRWLNELVTDIPSNEGLIARICVWLNAVYKDPGSYSRDVKNDFGVYLFWALNYSTIKYLKNHLDIQIISEGRVYLKAIDRNGYQDF